jgi:hypothetical protein
VIGVFEMNVRLRQMKKVMAPEDFWEIRDEYSRGDCCPLCGRELMKRSWSEDGPGGYGCVEIDERCRYCDYSRNWSYGDTSLVVGDWYDGYRPHRATHAEIERVEAEFTHQIKLFRAQRKVARQKYYRRKAR